MSSNSHIVWENRGWSNGGADNLSSTLQMITKFTLWTNGLFSQLGATCTC